MSTMGAIPTANEMTYILSDPNQADRHAENIQLKVSTSGFITSEGGGPGGGEGPGTPPDGTQLIGTEGEDRKYATVDEASEYQKEKSSLAFTSFNYINSIVGSGVIGMPYALNKAGFGLGILILFVVAYITDISLVLMIKAGRIAEASTYQDLVLATMGRPGFYAQSLLQFMYPFISLISYNIIVGDTMTKVLIRISQISSKSVLVRREFIVATTTVLITLPLSLYRNIARLGKISLISVVMIIAIAVAMIVRVSTMMEVVDTTERSWTFVNQDITSAIGIMSFAFMCHHSSFMVYDSLVDNTQERWNKVTHISITIAGILSFVFAVAGYAAFTSHVQGDIFENYCWVDDLMNVCRGLYAITILLTFPIECFVARDVVETAFFREHQPQPVFRHAALTVLIALVGMLLSLTTDCLGVVLELNGIMCAIPLAYVIPPLCYIRLEEGSLWARTKWKAWGVLIFGVVTASFGTFSLFSNLSDLLKCSHGKQMAYCFDNLASENETIPIEF